MESRWRFSPRCQRRIDRATLAAKPGTRFLAKPLMKYSWRGIMRLTSRRLLVPVSMNTCSNLCQRAASGSAGKRGRVPERGAAPCLSGRLARGRAQHRLLLAGYLLAQLRILGTTIRDSRKRHLYPGSPVGKRSLQCALRPRLPVDRMCAVHAPGGRGRRRAGGTMVVGDRRAEGVWDALRDRDRRLRA